MASTRHGHGPRLGPTNNPGNARWCEDEGHHRLECTKSRSKGRGPCHGPAIRGLDTCKIHSGHQRAVARAKGEARITAWSAIGRPAGGHQLDSGMAVLGMLQMTWLRAAAYGELLRQQVSKDGTSEVRVDGGNAGDTSGLIGYRYGAAGRDGNIYAVSEEARALVALEASERDRVVKYAKTAHDMGISERLTNLAERWGDVVATRITLILDGLELTPEQEARVAPLIQAHLSQIDMVTTGGTE
jgi:hypothetical protein